MAEIDGLLKIMAERGSSDLHIKVGSPPAVRLNGKLVVMTEYPSLSPDATRQLAVGMMDDRQEQSFENHRELDFAYSVPGVGRFRVNVFHQRGSVGMTLRRVTTERTGIEQLGLPPVVRRLAEEPRGLVLVTGTAGSGKTTTLAAMIDHINHTREGHIVTIEDPIEVLHQDVKCIINQREVGIDTESYADALRHVVRQDPDVVLIGEMRDHETVSAALTAAEIGNLVLSTLHTIDATETINRIIDFFPPYQQKQIRLMLASTLKGIISMRLIPAINGGLVPAVEVMVMTGTIREYVMDSEKTYMIRDAMEEGEYYGMQTFDQSLLRLYSQGRITLEDAVAMAQNAHDFRIKVRQLGVTAEQAAQTGVY
ncbi:MAG TPA: type IV pili twitching motility protein PilT [Coriobacteriia bacterium]|jgi:twitching motility protein PilT|uniref:type IV pilus twitching motility protein PilT n=1 Tax=Anaerosoma tenue TaxID=2933588 RepID=UPI00076CB7F5|nr:PilT/PilU family type 4a pilus ATPase [Anaerosoma tenue]KUK49086.1 MAG: Twitching mobility protein [Actinobacteria bacterium 66_15]MCK8115693.1 PilT/PilU family type 4a pilus ATPase [Anaerosoma tenue]HAL29415.1 type IV pili twitching motility protein PilT [Coriobacteriia bacterium]HHJ98772.1 PilT/PilU family type 4a pilus ATPase [Actinomycetota bacterium]